LKWDFLIKREILNFRETFHLNNRSMGHTLLIKQHRSVQNIFDRVPCFGMFIDNNSMIHDNLSKYCLSVKFPSLPETIDI